MEDDLRDRYLATAADEINPDPDDEDVVGFVKDLFGRPMPALDELLHARGPLPDAIVPLVNRRVRDFWKLTEFDILGQILKPSLDIAAAHELVVALSDLDVLRRRLRSISAMTLRRTWSGASAFV